MVLQVLIQRLRIRECSHCIPMLFSSELFLTTTAQTVREAIAALVARRLLDLIVWIQEMSYATKAAHQPCGFVRRLH